MPPLPGCSPALLLAVALILLALVNTGDARILCSDTPSALKWRLVNVHELNLINEYLVVGGYEDVRTAYIGRVSHSNHLIVGKVFTKEPKGLRIASPDKKEELFNTFEVLVYDPTD